MKDFIEQQVVGAIRGLLSGQVNVDFTPLGAHG